MLKAEELFLCDDGIHKMIWGMPGQVKDPLWPVEQWDEIIKAIEMLSSVAEYRKEQRIQQDRLNTQLI